ncbi:MAG: YIP1 family protein [Firmicutes bacterium]|nr:YIP1 family protein [Bacillota bacterium]
MDHKDENVYPGAEGESIHNKDQAPDRPADSARGDAPAAPGAGQQELPDIQAGAGPKTASGGGLVKDGILDLIYGVLFDPVRTFAGFAQQPPVFAAVIIVVLLSLAQALMGMFNTPYYLNGLQLPGIPAQDAMQALMPLATAGGFVLGFVEWFFMAGVLHLLAELYGGRGRARGVFAVYGLAGLPAALIIPLQLLVSFFPSSAGVNIISGLLSLAVFIWFVILLVIGIREVHGFSTGRAAFTVFTPVLALIVILFIGLIVFGSLAATLYTGDLY